MGDGTILPVIHTVNTGTILNNNVHVTCNQTRGCLPGGVCLGGVCLGVVCLGVVCPGGVCPGATRGGVSARHPLPW